MTETLRTGSCHCGSIKMRIAGAPVETHVCHCTSCKKLAGVAFGSWAVFREEQISLTTSSPEVLRIYEDASSDSGIVNDRYFCNTCGSFIKVINRAFKDFATVPTGILDEASQDLNPQREFYCIRKASWLGDIGTAVKFEGSYRKSATIEKEATSS
ncbi:Mss4-like protein [Xylariales sp. PMI_506]|nr:Mss4-like protein [Xylariales sp. PMI_506]